MKFTDKRIRDLKEVGLYQDEVEPMLRVRVGKRRKSYVCEFWAEGQQQSTFGAVEDFTVDEAREECRRRKREFKRNGVDWRQITLRDATENRIKVLKEEGKAAGTIEGAEYGMSFLERWMDCKMVDMEMHRHDIRALHRSMIDTPGAADVMLRQLRATWNHAAQWWTKLDTEMGRNPFHIIKYHRIKKPKKAVDAEALRQHWANLQEAPNEMGKLIFEFLMYVPLRRDEAAQLRWSEVFEGYPTNDPISLRDLMSIDLHSPDHCSANQAVKPILPLFSERETDEVYEILNAFLWALTSELETKTDEFLLSKPVVFRAFMGFFRPVAQRLVDRHGSEYSTENFTSVVSPVFQNMRIARLERPGTSSAALRDYLVDRLGAKLTL